MDVQTSASSRTIPFQFNGTAGEYFRIWIVNLVLTILTLGIYSAWAKVRTKRYFYSNTIVDSSSFEYLADPLVILRGRLIVAGVLLIYFAMTSYVPLLEAGFIVIYLVGLPWIVVKSLQFNTRNSAYRNIRFDFTGRFKEAIIIFIALPIVAVLTFGLAFPYMIKRMQEFTVGNSRFGTTQFDIGLSAWAIFRIYFFVLIIPIMGIVAAIAIPAYQSYTDQIQGTPQTEQVLTEERAEFERTLEKLEQMDNQPASPDNETGGPANKTGINTGNIPDADTDPVSTAIFLGINILIYLLYIFIFAYIKTRTTNLVFNSTRLNSIQFKCDMRVRDVFTIYMTNIIAILISFGLLIPWAKIRISRYRVSHTSMIVSENIEEFIHGEQQGVKATAGEFADILDVDIGI